MKTLLVTGGCGFIGSHFIKLIWRERPQYTVINLDLLTYAGNLENLADPEREFNTSTYRFVRGDIADVELTRQLIQDAKVDAIVNFAAETHVDRSLLDSAPFLRTNVDGTRVLLDAGSRCGIERFLQVSTDEVYGSLEPSAPPCSEEHALQPNSPYAASKAAADLLVRAYHESYGVPVLVTRCGNNYGPHQFPEKFLPLFITNALEDKPLPLYGDGRQIRDWIHVEDHARALLQVLEKGRIGETYNVSAQSEQTNLHMAQWVLSLMGKPPALLRYVNDRPGHDRRYGLDPSKLRGELGWQPRIPLDDGLRATIEWYRAHRGWWERIKSGEYRNYYTQQYGQRLSET
ncbi:MAG TPA: dTDP-glucose 4,6-dehydratase [Candidatus Binatia bacterium]|nr:dTDP-glucose 4,6-dehydratase [Candidatus Binatia bacterium]